MDSLNFLNSIYGQPILEGRNEDIARQKLTKAGKEGDYEKIDAIDRTATKKHLPKLVDYYLENPSQINIIKSYYERFANNPKINTKDIYQFKTFHDFEQFVDSNMSAPKASTVDITQEKPLYQDEDLTVWLGDSRDKCQALGRGTTWCIASQSSGNMYHTYRERGASFYFIKIKSRPESDNHSFIVIHSYGKGDNFGITLKNNAGGGDRHLSLEDLLQEVPELKPLFDKGIIKHTPLSPEETEMYSVQSKDYKTLNADQKMMYIEVGKSQLSDAEWDVSLPEHKAKYIELGGYDLTDHQKSDLEKTAPKLLARYWDKSFQRAEILFQHGQELTIDSAVAVLKKAQAEKSQEKAGEAPAAPAQESMKSLALRLIGG